VWVHTGRAVGRRPQGALLSIFLDTGNAPLWRRLGDSIRTAVTQGVLAPGARLPSARSLAADLHVSRATVESALGELEAEGLIERRMGSGSFVSPLAGRDLRPSSPPRAPPRSVPPPPAPRALSERGRQLVAWGSPVLPNMRSTFTLKPPAEDFPHAAWAKLASRCLREGGAALALDLDPLGHLPLRQAIAQHLRTNRGMHCAADNVLIVGSTQEAFVLCAHALLSPGDEVWMEDPGYPGATGAFRMAGAQIVPVPVDADGLRVQDGVRAAPHARLVYITPSCQFPCGVTLSRERRETLLRWAEASGAWVFEDDYDSELRYAGLPLAALHAHDAGARTLYAGTFSKTLFPSLRVAYLVAEPDTVRDLAAVRANFGGPPGAGVQATLAAFLDEGLLGAHVRHLRARCEERRAALLDAAARELGARITIHAGDTGQHAVAWLAHGEDDDATVSQRARAAGLDVPPLSQYVIAHPQPPALVIGYTSATPAAIRAAVRTLAHCLSAGAIT